MLAEWFFFNERLVIISSEIVREKARWFWQHLPQYNSITEPFFSKGWLHKFKARHGIKSWRRHGEAGIVDLDEARMAADIASIQAKVA